MVREYKYRLLLLHEWKNVVEKVAKVVKRLYPEAEVYLMGGVAEGRATIYSDVDIAIVFQKTLSKSERVDILAHIWESLEGVIPLYYPLEIHILGIEEFMRLKGKKVKLV